MHRNSYTSAPTAGSATPNKLVDSGRPAGTADHAGRGPGATRGGRTRRKIGDRDPIAGVISTKPSAARSWRAAPNVLGLIPVLDARAAVRVLETISASSDSTHSTSASSSCSRSSSGHRSSSRTCRWSSSSSPTDASTSTATTTISGPSRPARGSSERRTDRLSAARRPDRSSAAGTSTDQRMDARRHHDDRPYLQSKTRLTKTARGRPPKRAPTPAGIHVVEPPADGAERGGIDASEEPAPLKGACP